MCAETTVACRAQHRDFVAELAAILHCVGAIGQEGFKLVAQVVHDHAFAIVAERTPPERQLSEAAERGSTDIEPCLTVYDRPVDRHARKADETRSMLTEHRAADTKMM